MGNKPQPLFLVFDTEFFSFMGVFTTAEQAIGCCSTIMYGIGPALLDEVVPSNHVEWPGFWWPLREPQPKLSIEKLLPEPVKSGYTDIISDGGMDPREEFITLRNGRSYPKNLLEKVHAKLEAKVAANPEFYSQEFLASALQCNDEECPYPEPVEPNGHIKVALAEHYPAGWNSPIVYCPNIPDIEIAKMQSVRIVEELVNTQPIPPDTLDFFLKCPDFRNEISLADEPKKPEPYYKTLKGKRGSK